jgi:hypothetical protein
LTQENFLIYKNKKTMSISINLNNPKTVVLREADVKTFNTITISRMIDIPKQKIVRVFIEELDNPILLWEGEEYDNIGQWTDEDVIEKLNELYNQE